MIPGGLSEPRQPARSPWRNAEGLLAAYCLAAVATAVAVATGGTRHPLIALAMLALAVLIAAARLALPAAVAAGVIGWLYYDGFIIGRHADLGWDGTREAWWLLVLVAAAGLGWALGHLARHG